MSLDNRINQFQHPRDANTQCCQAGCNRICWCYTICPCSKQVFPGYLEIDCCYCKHEFDHGIMIPNELEVSGTFCCESTKNDYNNYIPTWYVVARIILTIWYFIGLLTNLINMCFKTSKGCVAMLYWPMYLTSQVNMIGLAYMILQTYIIIKFRKVTNTQLLTWDQVNSRIRLFYCNKVLLQIALVGLLIVVVQYYILVFPDVVFRDSFDVYAQIHAHGISFVLVLINFIISYQHIYYKSAYFIIMYGIGYTFWLIIHYLSQIGNEKGDRYLYKIFDFGANLTSAVVALFGVYLSGFMFNSLCAFLKNIILCSCGSTFEGDNTGADNGVELEVQT